MAVVIVGRCSGVIFPIKIRNGTSKWWSLVGSRNSDVVVSSVLTVLISLQLDNFLDTAFLVIKQGKLLQKMQYM